MSKLFRELWVGKGRQRRYVQAMNPMVGVLRRNIASLIRRGRSVKLRRPMDSEGVGSTSGQRSVTEMVPTTPAEGSTKLAQEDRGHHGHEEEAASIMIGLPESTAGQPATAQEKKKQRQFDFSMSVFY